jgi:hypothetical protein
MPVCSKKVLAVGAIAAAAAGCTFGSRDSQPAAARKVSAEAPASADRRAYGNAQAETRGGSAEVAARPSAAAVSTGPASSRGLAGVFASLKLIRTAQITVEVPSYERAAAEVARVAEGLGGYVAETQAARGQQERQSGTVTIRVPAERFGAAMDALKGLGKTRSENVSTQDVTREYADLETRLQVKRDAAGRLRELLRTRTAGLNDVLNAERELARVTEEIERMEGERRFYDQQVALSTIALTLLEPQALVEPGVFAPITQALRDSAEVLARSLAAIVYLAVFLAPWSVVALAAWRVLKAVRARRKMARAEA